MLQQNEGQGTTTCHLKCLGRSRRPTVFVFFCSFFWQNRRTTANQCLKVEFAVCSCFLDQFFQTENSLC